MFDDVFVAVAVVVFLSSLLKSLRKPQRQRQRQRQRRWTKGLKSRKMAVHVRYNSWYISLPSSAKQQREMTTFLVVRRMWTTTANFSTFYFNFIAVSQIQFRDSFEWKTK